MPCNNCNTSSSCEPCSVCMPPGVTNLPQCTPVDPCEEKISLKCILYSGEDHECSGINHLDSLQSVIFKILSTIYPSEYCCSLTNDCP